jgi:hypothetical protein
VAALAVAAPLVWMASDLILAGDPLFSLHRTGDVATAIQPQRGIGQALRLAPRFVNEILGGPVFWLGIAGSVLGLRVRTERMALPAALIALSVVPFLAYGLTDLTLYARFLLPTCAVLALFCAVLTVYLAEQARLTWPRLGWAAAAAVAVVALVATVPATIRSVADERGRLSARRHLEDDLTRVVSGLSSERYRRCPVFQVPGRVVVPELIRATRVPGEAFTETPRGRLRRGLVLTVPATSRRRYVLNPDNRTGLRGWQREPGSDLPLLARSRLWRLNGAC